MNANEIREKYATEFARDDDASKLLNKRLHALKKNGDSPKDKLDRTYENQQAYVDAANRKIGDDVKILQRRGNGVASFGINWSAIGTASVPQTQAFIKKLQMAIGFVQNIPKSPAKARY